MKKTPPFTNQTTQAKQLRRWSRSDGSLRRCGRPSGATRSGCCRRPLL